MGKTKWDNSIIGVAKEKRNPPKFRMGAIDKMVLYGPFPDANTLTELSQDERPEIRAKVAQLCGLESNAGNVALLAQLIKDKNPVSYTHLTLPTTPYV